MLRNRLSQQAIRKIGVWVAGGVALSAAFNGCAQQAASLTTGGNYHTLYTSYSNYTPYTGYAYSPYSSGASGYDDLANDFYYGTGGNDGYYYSGIGGTVASDGETSYFFDSDSGVVIGP